MISKRLKMNLAKLLFSVIYVFHHSLLLVTNALLNCRDENGDIVDWFFLYKLPDEKASNNDNGTQYMFITPKTASNGWIVSKNLITDVESIPAITLKPMYDDTNETLWILYNDQPPDGAKVTKRGHTKGVVGVDKSGGFWLVHSVPNFPPSPNASGYSYPVSGLKFGQSFLCLSLRENDIDKVGTQLQYNQISVYWRKIYEDLKGKYPKLVAAANGQRIKRPPWSNLITLTSAAGNEFHSFAKSSGFREDLYEWVGPELESNLLVETWLNGRGALPSNCSKKYTVKNIDEVKLCQGSQCTSFTSTKDHSKWAVSSNISNPWLCVGDINRAKSQERRGGGTVCMKNPTIWQSYYNSVAGVQPCPIKKKSLHDTAEVIIA